MTAPDQPANGVRIVPLTLDEVLDARQRPLTPQRLAARRAWDRYSEEREAELVACSLCANGPRPVQREDLTPAECTAIAAHSGLTGETHEGCPVVAAVLIRRRVSMRIPGRKAQVWAWCDRDQPYFACPWSRFAPAQRPFLAHGGACHGDANYFERDADGRFALDHRVSHCQAAGLPRGGYYLRYIELPDLPRLRINRQTSRLEPIDDKASS
jgi:hypothetical protein